MATPIAGLGIPRYPDSLRTANVSGEVLTMFVVNADGSVDPGTLKVVKSSHPLFTDAVRNALPEMRFQPAMVKGRAVRQLVQMPYAFSTGTDGERVGWRVEYLPPVMKPIGKP